MHNSYVTKLRRRISNSLSSHKYVQGSEVKPHFITGWKVRCLLFIFLKTNWCNDIVKAASIALNELIIHHSLLSTGINSISDVLVHEEINGINIFTCRYEVMTHLAPGSSFDSNFGVIGLTNSKDRTPLHQTIPWINLWPIHEFIRYITSVGYPEVTWPHQEVFSFPNP